MGVPADRKQASNPIVLDALKGLPVSRPPFWFMRQAGRYLPEYREIRQRTGGFLEMCYDPDLAAEVTLQPIRRFGMDAAILFSDILVIPHALGCKVWFEDNEGPRLLRVGTDIETDQLGFDNFETHLAPVYAAIKSIRRELASATALIGFAGMPWTLASYMIEGRSSKDWQAARLFARRFPDRFQGLIDLLTEAVILHLSRQIAAGAQLVQLFDSWAGALGPDELRRWSIEPCRRIVNALREQYPATPILAFPRGIGMSYPAFAEQTGVDGVSLDTTVSPGIARARFETQPSVCLQGNLDPVALAIGGDLMIDEARKIVEAWHGRRFIFNLGHGVLPITNPDEMERLCRYLQSSSI